MTVHTNKVKISKGLRCKNCKQQTMYPIIYTKNIKFNNIVDNEPFICEHCGKQFFASRTGNIITFSEKRY